MKIKIKANGCTNITKEFNNRTELLMFVQSKIQNTIYSNDEKEKRKWKILETNNQYRFSIYELIEMIDYTIIKKQMEVKL